MLAFFIAWKAYKTLRSPDTTIKQESSGYDNLFRAVLVNLFNPNPYLDWSLVMGPMMIKGWNSRVIIYLTPQAYSPLSHTAFGESLKRKY